MHILRDVCSSWSNWSWLNSEGRSIGQCCSPQFLYPATNLGTLSHPQDLQAASRLLTALFQSPCPTQTWSCPSFSYTKCSYLGSCSHKITVSSNCLYCCSVPKLCLTLCAPMDYSTPGFPVLHHLPKFAQTHAHWVSDTIQQSHPLPPPSPFAFNVSHHQGLFQWVSSSHHVAKVFAVSALAWVLPMNIQDWFPSIPIDLGINLYHDSLR